MLSFIHNTNGFMYCIQSTLLEGYALMAASDEFTTGWKSVAGHFVHTGPLNSFALFTKMFERPGVEISVWLLRCEKRKRILVACERKYDWQQRKTQLWKRPLNFWVRVFFKGAVTWFRVNWTPKRTNFNLSVYSRVNQKNNGVHESPKTK